MNNYTFFICEGPHDIAFVEKILLFLGAKKNGKLKISDFDAPLNGLFEVQAKRTGLQHLNFSEARGSDLPSSTLQYENQTAFLYCMNGDSKAESRKKLINSVLDLPSEEEEITGGHSTPQSYNIIYIYDADEKGKENRLQEINSEINSIDYLKDEMDISQGSVTQRGVTFNAHIFTELGKDTGKLEDLLIPLMKHGNDGIFNAAKNIIDSYFDVNRTKVLRQALCPETEDLTESRKGKTGFCEKKALIGISGQLQCSGSANTTHIARTDYIRHEDLSSSIAIRPLKTFLKQTLQIS